MSRLRRGRASHASGHRSGLIDEDEFEELVKSIIAQSRREAREAEQAALADLRDDQVAGSRRTRILSDCRF